MIDDLESFQITGRESPVWVQCFRIETLRRVRERMDNAVFALLLPIVTVLSVGIASSKLTLEALVLAVTCTPAFPAASVKSIVKATGPAVSATCISRGAV